MMTGLGTAGQSVSNYKPSVIDTGLGTSADCSTWNGWLLNSGCWKYSTSAWEQMNEFAAIENLPAPVAPAAVPLNSNGTPACATANCSDEIAASQAAALEQTYQNTLTWYQVQGPNVPPSCGIFGNDVPTLDASGNWKCPSLFDVSNILLIAAAIAAGFLVVGLKK